MSSVVWVEVQVVRNTVVAVVAVAVPPAYVAHNTRLESSPQVSDEREEKLLVLEKTWFQTQDKRQVS